MDSMSTEVLPTTFTSSPVPTQTEDPNAESSDTMRITYFAVLAVFIPVGLVLNTLALVVLLASDKLRKTSTGHFLIALAVADSIFLVGEFLRWLNTFYDTEGYVLGISFMDTNYFWCIATYFLRYTGQLLSATITVSIAIQRTLCIYKPLQAAVMSTSTRAKIILAAIFVVCVALGVTVVAVVGLVYYEGGTVCGYFHQKSYHIWYWIVIRALTMIIPWIVLAVLTCAINYKLRQVEAFRKRASTISSQGFSVYTGVEKQLTRMLLVVVVAFLVLRGPYIITYSLLLYKHDIWVPLTPTTDFRIIVVNDFCDCLSTLNYCINFFLYFASGSTFRCQFGRVFCCEHSQQRPRVDSLGIPLNSQTTKTSPLTSLTNIHTCLKPMESVSTTKQKK